MADKRSPRNGEPVPTVSRQDEEQHDFNPVVEDEDTVIPGVVPPEGHDLQDDDDPATSIHESRMEEYEEDIAVESISDTQHSDGSTYNPTHANEQGLVYTPPSDPPVEPGNDYQSGDVAAGFAPSMETSNPDVMDLPDGVDNNDWDLVNDIQEALRVNSETRHLHNIHYQVQNGIVTVRGTVSTQDDLGRAERVIAYLDGVHDVISEVELADESIE